MNAVPALGYGTVENFLVLLGRGSAQAAVLVMAVLIVQRLLARWLGPRRRCALWYLVIARLLVPVSIPSPTSLYNWLPVPASVRTGVAPGALDHDVARVLPPAAGSGFGSEAELGARSGLARRDEPRPVARPSSSSRAKFEVEGVAVGVEAARGSGAQAGTTLRNNHPGADPSAVEIWPWLLFAVWGVGAMGMLMRTGRNVVGTARRLRDSVEIRDPEIRSILNDARARLRVRGEVKIVEVAGLPGPAVYGLIAPRVLLPPGFTSAYSAEELRFVFLHELAHLKRRDLALNWLIALLQALHWFNPLVWLGFARWRMDRELACDALALEAADRGSNQAYGRTILRLLEGLAERTAAPAGVGILENKRQWRRRIVAIATFAPARRWSLPAALVFALLAAVGLTDGQTAGPRPVPAPASGAGGAAGPAQVRPAEGASPARRIVTRLTVVEEETGTPLPGTRLAVGYFYAGSRMERAEFATGDDGAVAIRAHDDDTFRAVNLFATAFGHVPKVISWRAMGDVPGSYVLRLPRAATIAGVVRDAAGRVVPGVVVTPVSPGLTDLAAVENIAFHPRHTAVTSDGVGHWSLPYVPTEMEKVRVRLAHPDFAVTLAEVAVGGVNRTNARVALEPGVRVEGRVVGSDGAPVAGADVREVHNRGYEPRSTRADEDGNFVLKGVAAGTMLLVAQAPLRAPRLLTVTETGPVARVELKLEPGRIFQGRVIDDAGQPLAGAVVQTDWDNQGLRAVAWETRTDADGRFVWDSAPDDALLFWFEAPGYEAKRDLRLRPRTRDHHITLSRRAAKATRLVTGQVVDVDTGQPVERFRVSAGEIRVAGLAPDFLHGNQGRDGRYRMTIRADRPAQSYVLLAEADGYLPAKAELPSGGGETNETVTVDFQLRRGSGPAGTVAFADGRSAAGAKAYLITHRDGVYMQEGGIAREDVTRARMVPVTMDGVSYRFSFPPVHDAYSVIVLHPEGFAEVKVGDLQKDPLVVLRPWGRVEGQMWVGARPAANETINVSTFPYRYGDGVRPFASLQLWLSARTDGEGRFVLEKVPPVECRISHRLSGWEGRSGSIPDTQGRPIQVQAGETVQVRLGGKGRAVVGRVAAPEHGEPIDWRRDVHRLTLSLPDPSERGRPQRADYESSAAFGAAFQKFSDRHRAFWTSEEGRALERAQRAYTAVFTGDGGFRVDDVPPGTYTLVVRPTRRRPNAGPVPFPAEEEVIGTVTNTFVVSAEAGPRAAEPLDLGTLPLVIRSRPATGKPAPAFDVASLRTAGGRVRLDDFGGRLVLVHFWATWCGPCVAEMPELRAVWAAHRENPRFAMVGLNLDERPEAAREFAGTNGLEWAQGHLGDWAKTVVPSQYGVQGIPAVFLVDADGVLLEQGLRGPELNAAVTQALQR